MDDLLPEHLTIHQDEMLAQMVSQVKQGLGSANKHSANKHESPMDISYINQGKAFFKLILNIFR